MANKNIEMKQMNSSGSYDNLYPKTLSTNVTISSSTASAMGLASTATVDQALSTLQSKQNGIGVGDILLTAQELSDNYMRCDGSLYKPEELPAFSQVYRNGGIPFYDIYEEVGDLGTLAGLTSGGVRWAKEIKINNATYMCVGICNMSSYKGKVLLFNGNSWYTIWEGTESYVYPLDACVYKGVFIFAVDYHGETSTGAFRIFGYDASLGSITNSSSYRQLYASSNTYHIPQDQTTKKFVESDSHINILVTSRSGTSSSATEYYKIAYSTNGTTWSLTGDISAVSTNKTYSGACALAYDKISKKFYLFHSKYYNTGMASFCVEQNTTQTSVFTVLRQNSFSCSTNLYQTIHYFKSYNNVFYFSTCLNGNRQMLKCVLSNLTNASTYDTGYTKLGTYTHSEKIDGDYVYAYSYNEIKKLNFTNGELITERFYIPVNSAHGNPSQAPFVSFEICRINGYDYCLSSDDTNLPTFNEVKLYRGSKRYGPILSSPLDEFNYYVKIK